MDAEPHQTHRFLWLYALAAAGGAVAFFPFLTLLLPARAVVVAGTGAVALLATAAVVGAIVASVAHIAFGWLSDWSGRRRPWIAAGLVASSAILSVMPQIDEPWAIVAMVAVWQAALNLMLAPLGAWAGDCVPDLQKGRLGGLLAIAPASGALIGLLVTLEGGVPIAWRMPVVAGIVVVMVAPVLIAGRPRPMPHLARLPADRSRTTQRARRMWLARALVQVAEAALFAFLLLWMRTVAPGVSDGQAALLFTVALVAAVGAAAAAGRWSDRRGRPIAPLIAAAAVAGVALAVMASASGAAVALGGYLMFGVASGVFLSLHSAQMLRVLPDPARRGRDLGIVNLTNTLPAMVMPGLTIALVPRFGYAALFAVLAVLALAAAAILMPVAARKDRSLR